MLSCMESPGKWDELVDSCRFYEQLLRMVDVASMRQVEQQILCPYCGKKGHAKKDCWKENVVEKMMLKASIKVMEKEKMVVNRAMERMTEKKRRRSSRKTSAIEADRQVAMEAVQAMMVRGALLVAALRKGLL